MRDIRLTGLGDFFGRVESIRKSFETIYGVRLGVFSEDVLLDRLYPTEDFLENDKLALVFMKVVREGYDVPIVAVKRDEDYFVLDGHHRSFVRKHLSGKKISAHVLEFPADRSYRAVLKRELMDLPIKEIGVIDDSLVKAWEQILTVLKYYEALYHVYFYLRKEEVCLKDLVPTQSQVKRKQVDSIKKLLVPIACVQYQGRYYVLDGHARSLRARELELEAVQAMVLWPEIPLDYGIVKTARDMGLESLDDVRVVD